MPAYSFDDSRASEWQIQCVQLWRRIVGYSQSKRPKRQETSGLQWQHTLDELDTANRQPIELGKDLYMCLYRCAWQSLDLTLNLGTQAWAPLLNKDAAWVGKAQWLAPSNSEGPIWRFYAKSTLGQNKSCLWVLLPNSYQTDRRLVRNYRFRGGFTGL